MAKTTPSAQPDPGDPVVLRNDGEPFDHEHQGRIDTGATFTVPRHVFDRWAQPLPAALVVVYPDSGSAGDSSDSTPPATA